MKKLKNKFVILTAAYNSVDLVKKNISMSLSQDFEGMGIIIIDDASTDGTYEAIRQELARHANIPSSWPANINGKDVILIRNKKRTASPVYNYYRACKYISNPRSICAIVDGDDWLIEKNSISKVYSAFGNNDICWSNFWVNPLLDNKILRIIKNRVPVEPRWAQPMVDIISSLLLRVLSKPGEKGFCAPLDNIKPVRKQKWVTSHMRMFRKLLMDKVALKDLKGKDGKYYQAAGDLAQMYPMLEMAGPKRRKYIDIISISYNINTGNNVHDVKTKIQIEEEKQVLNSKPYKCINT